MRKVNITLLSAFVVLACGLSVFADSWALPEPEKYYSESKQYYIEVVPRQLESQLKYFQDKVANKEPAGSKPGVKDNYCKGIFYKRNATGGYEKVWENRLSNDVAPVKALVSNSGEYLVTFDNWHKIGDGDDVVVVYGPGGKMISKMGLADFISPNTPLPRSVSSIYWGGKHYIDEKNLLLVLKVIDKWKGSIEEEPQYRDVKVSLKTGELLKPGVAAE